MPHKIATTTDLRTAIEKQCPILLCVPYDVPHLSQVFNDDGISDENLGMKPVKAWVREHNKGNHAVLMPQNWSEFEVSLDRICRRGLANKLDIAYEDRVISLHNAMMQFGGTNILDDHWGNGSGAYVLYEDEKRRVGMARLFNQEGHVRIKIPFREKGQAGVNWSDITPDINANQVDRKDVKPFSFVEHTARAYE